MGQNDPPLGRPRVKKHLVSVNTIGGTKIFYLSFFPRRLIGNLSGEYPVKIASYPGFSEEKILPGNIPRKSSIQDWSGDNL